MFKFCWFVSRQLLVIVETKIVITEHTPLTSLQHLELVNLNPIYFSRFYQPHKATNLVQPGGASVQGEDVTQSGVRRLFHWGCWHITYSYACWSGEQIRISNSFLYYLRREMKFCESYFGREVQSEGVVSASFSINVAGSFQMAELRGGRR